MVSTMGSERSLVGMLWSAVATVKSARRTFRPRSRRPWNACGEVTSCTRCRSMYSNVGALGCSCTTCASQIFSMMVLGLLMKLTYGRADGLADVLGGGGASRWLEVRGYRP